MFPLINVVAINYLIDSFVAINYSSIRFLRSLIVCSDEIFPDFFLSFAVQRFVENFMDRLKKCGFLYIETFLYQFSKSVNCHKVNFEKKSLFIQFFCFFL